MTDEIQTLEELSKEAGKCTNCGFCESVCPTLPAMGYNLIYGARGRVDLGNYILKELPKNGKLSLRFKDSFYSCLSCNACLQVCPAGVNAGKVSELSRRLIADYDSFTTENEQKTAKMIVNVTMKYMNPLGVREKCATWSRDIAFDSKSKSLFYTGNMFQLMPYSVSLGKMKKKIGKKISDRISEFISNHPSFIKIVGMSADRDLSDRMREELLNIVRLLKDSGISFSYLGEDEPYPGTFLYDLGYEKEFSEYANRVYSLFKSKGIEELIVLDPHTYDILSSKYPKYVKNFDLQVVYYLDLLDISKFNRTNVKTTIHEPCLLVRGSKENNSPVEILSKLSDLELPNRNGKNTNCCGGPDELLYGEIAERVAEERLTQLERVKAQKIVTACPVCFANLNKKSNVVELPDFLTTISGEK